MALRDHCGGASLGGCSRRDCLKMGSSAVLGLSLPSLCLRAARAAVPLGALPAEPLEIGQEPQFVLDLYAVDCTWGLRSKGEPVRRVFHQPTKHPANPVLTGDVPSWLWAMRDEGGGPIHLWYQSNLPYTGRKANFATSIAYARSDDGIHWEKPV